MCMAGVGRLYSDYHVRRGWGVAKAALALPSWPGHAARVHNATTSRSRDPSSRDATHRGPCDGASACGKSVMSRRPHDRTSVVDASTHAPVLATPLGRGSRTGHGCPFGALAARRQGEASVRGSAPMAPLVRRPPEPSHGRAVTPTPRQRTDVLQALKIGRAGWFLKACRT